jgi:hypothetical protein
LLLTASSQARWIAADGARLITEAVRQHRWTLPVALIAIAAVGAALFAIVREGERGEPLRFLEGVSMWPTEIVRAIAAVLAVIFLAKAYRTVHAITGHLTEAYFPESRTAEPPATVSWSRIFAGRVREQAPVDATLIWREYLIQVVPAINSPAFSRRRSPSIFSASACCPSSVRPTIPIGATRSGGSTSSSCC